MFAWGPEGQGWAKYSVRNCSVERRNLRHVIFRGQENDQDGPVSFPFVLPPMASFRPYVWNFVKEFIAGTKYSLSQTRMQYHWKDVTDGVVVNSVLGITNSAKKGERPNFSIFGEVERQTGNLIYLKRPAFDLTVQLERDIGLSYDRQLLNLAGALQAQDRPYNFTCGQLILTTDIEFDVPIGCIFLGWVILKIFDDCQDGYDEIYELSVAGEVATVAVY
ncbi:hypothetical protein B0H17DRAFT_1136992 [Mycena rosella]|uniref:Uncharacterized protein n=1 Tax=Mycena rosella TaxID=1033263 RepID=A0AAD7D9M3_MYCRO|nr:hypothetical protein B0H17DRAFT_1136992 [Mycena rosella]